MKGLESCHTAVKHSLAGDWILECCYKGTQCIWVWEASSFYFGYFYGQAQLAKHSLLPLSRYHVPASKW